MTTVLMMAGAWDLACTTMRQKLRGTVTEVPGRTVTPVLYNNWDLVFGAYDGADKLDQALHAAPKSDNIIVFGMSFGSVSASIWLRGKGTGSDISPDRLSFILLGNSIAQRNGLMRWLYGEPPTETRYQVTQVTIRWEMWADWPDVSGSPYLMKATDNARMGDIDPPALHGKGYDAITLGDPHWEATVGNMTYMLFPTLQTPLAPGVTLKQIESAYHRLVASVPENWRS